MPQLDSAAATATVVIDLFDAGGELFLPTAYIVSCDEEGYLLHVQQRATAETIGAFNLELTPDRQRLFELIDELDVTVIEKQFHPGGRRRQPPLDKLMQDRETLRQIRQYVHQRLDEILQLVVRHDWPLTWALERHVLANDFLLQTQRPRLEPELYFKRTEQRVVYRLQLREGEESWRISEREVNFFDMVAKSLKITPAELAGIVAA